MNTEKIVMRKLALSDLYYRVELLNNPQIREGLNVSEIFCINKTIDWFNSSVKENTLRYDVVFTVDNIPIGMAGLTNISNINANAELYIYIDPIYQGLGYGIRSLVKLCSLGFDVLYLHKIFLFTFEKNEIANNLYLKCGFQKEALLREQTYKDGLFYNRCVFGLLKNDFVK